MPDGAIKEEISMTYRELAESLNEAVAGICSLDPDQRASWVSYFFETLEAEINKDILEEARTILEERLRLGQW